uniref:C2H2-type domain-containing protein n=1 Tax=Hucho hucho TaxID=62062 RepID=A0A4W5JQI0_9TELE
MARGQGGSSNTSHLRVVAPASTSSGIIGSGGKEKLFPCSFCGKAFSFPKQVEIHQRMHTGEKPFGCQLCAKRFSHQHQLKMHLKVHTGERPFACTHCGKRFSERSYLRIHQQTAHV